MSWIRTKEYNQACIWVADTVEEDVEDGKLIFDGSTFADFVFHNLAKQHGGLADDEDFPATVVLTEPAAEMLVSLAMEDYQFHDTLIRYCGLRLSAGHPLGAALSLFSGALILGQLKRPTKRHRPRKANWLEKNLLYTLTRVAARKFNLDETRNDERSGGPFSASDAVAEGLTTCGVPTSYSSIKNLLVHQDHERFRMESIVGMRLLGMTSLATNQQRKTYWEDEERWLEKIALDIFATFPPTE